MISFPEMIIIIFSGNIILNDNNVWNIKYSNFSGNIIEKLKWKNLHVQFVDVTCGAIRFSLVMAWFMAYSMAICNGYSKLSFN